MSCHMMTKEDIMVCKMIGKIGEKWVVSLQYPPRRLLSPGEVFFLLFPFKSSFSLDSSPIPIGMSYRHGMIVIEFPLKVVKTFLPKVLE
jgi:hypothetical protein